MKEKNLIKKSIVVEGTYTYSGTTLDNQAHGSGTFIFNNGDKYTGECQYDRLDGFGIYLFRDNSTYTGYFSFGAFHGLGTFEDENSIIKGTWRNDLFHGKFYRTNKKKFISHEERWNDNIIQTYKKIQYMSPTLLQTTKVYKKVRFSFKSNGKKCMACYEQLASATSINCGHVCMCWDCLGKCTTCPICRCPMEKIIKLYLC